MKGILSLAVCFLSVVVLSASEPAGSLIQFESDFLTAKKKASETNKFQLIIFNADWCKPCVWMNENTFTDQSVIDFVNKNAISSMVNIDSESGYQLLNTYKVKYLPTIIILNSRGEEVNRKEEIMDGPAMYNFISNYIPSYYPKTTKLAQPVKAAPKTDLIEKESVKTQPTPKPEEVALSNQPVSTSTLYKVELKEIEAKGYGVQVGVFTEQNKAMKEAERLKKLVPASDLLIHSLETPAGVKYKLIFGSFATATQANNLLIALKAKKIDGLLKDLSAL